jgi:hypothetical protein
LVVTIGRMGLHIYDVDREKWLVNTGEFGYEYDSFATDIIEGDLEDSESEERHKNLEY